MEPQVPYDPQQPYPWYAFMRRHLPLWYNEQEPSWHVFRYADVQYVLTHPTLFSSEIVLSPGLPRIITLMDDHSTPLGLTALVSVSYNLLYSS